MGRVQRLSRQVADQIAAGEVVERPAAVVRELVENSIDAGAGWIEARFLGAGKAEIRVRDDGIGMSPEDARAALERHATSKIRALDDLDGIASLGFRGEALPAIASVSRFRMRTRERDTATGHQCVVEGGSAPVESAVGMAPGTEVEVRDLFFNTPARFKFLKADRTESGRLVAAMENLALAWPEVGFRLSEGERKVLDVEPVGDLAARIGQVEPRWAKDAIAVDAEAGAFRVRAFLTPPAALRGGVARLRIFVNGRVVQDRGLHRAVLDAYRRISSRPGTPKALVFFDLPPEAVDVNVHPAKAEVRFRDSGAAFRAVFQAVQTALEGSPKRVTLAPPEHPRWGGRTFREGQLAGETVTGLDGRSASRMLYGDVPSEPLDTPAFLDFGSQPPRFLGQFHRSFLIAEEEGELLLIDQHAAEERVLFNLLMEGRDAGGVAPLLQPVPLELSVSERVLLERERDRLEAAGFRIEDFGDGWILRAVPEALGLSRGLEVLLRSLAGEERECAAVATHDATARLMARVACHAAVTAHVELDADRCRDLLARLWRTQNPGTCPHGRPTVLRLALSLIERRFHRR